jgi:hypothetical protein
MHLNVCCRQCYGDVLYGVPNDVPEVIPTKVPDVVPQSHSQ